MRFSFETPFIAKRMRRFARARSGATAVEFALVAAPFFFLLFALIETAAVFFMGAVLENAVLVASREIRTGQLQSSGATIDDFKQKVCDQISVIGDCNRMTFDVRVFQNFSGVQPTNVLDENNELDTGGFGYQPGQPGDIVLVRVFYTWRLITPTLGTPLSNMSGNNRLITAVTVFRNEPYSE